MSLSEVEAVLGIKTEWETPRLHADLECCGYEFLVCVPCKKISNHDL